MKAIILTDDTKSQLPSHNKWTNRFGIGSGIIKNPSICYLVKTENIKFPTNDIENESLYKKILHEYVRPAENMYGGRFAEIRYFENQLKKILSVEVLIISGRYGLITGNAEIIPYNHSIRTITELRDFDIKNKLIENLKNKLSDPGYLIILLPKFFIEFFIRYRLFDDIPHESKIFIVSSKEFAEPLQKYGNITIFERKGVSRLRNQNCEEMLSIIKRTLEINQESAKK